MSTGRRSPRKSPSAQALRAPGLADHRRHAPFHRGDRGRRHRSACRVAPEGQHRMNLILASASPVRRTMLENAGIAVEAVPAEIDERAVEQALEGAGATPEDVALVLAEAKAPRVSEDSAGRAGASAATRRCVLTASSSQAGRHGGRTPHPAGAVRQDASAACRGRAGPRRREPLGHCETASLTMRKLAPAYIGRLSCARSARRHCRASAPTRWKARVSSCSSKIDGDYFTILGLPLLPVLAALRDRGAIEAETGRRPSSSASRSTHSRSPLIHGYWLQHYGIAGDYEATTSRRRISTRCSAACAKRGFAGGNVTMPHKEAAFAAVRSATCGAPRCSAPPTRFGSRTATRLRRQHRRRRLYRQSRRRRTGLGEGGTGVVLGAGGAARAVIHALIRAAYATSASSTAPSSGRALADVRRRASAMALGAAAELLGAGRTARQHHVTRHGRQ